MKLRYRQITPADLPAVFSVRLSTIENAITMRELEDDYGITLDSLAKAMSSHVKGWLCEDSEVVVGFAMGDRLNGEVQVVAVLPEYERNGIGKSLLTKVQNWLLSEGHEEIWLGSNPDPTIRAYGFYRKLGWQATGRMKGYDEIMVFRPDKEG
jgi:ribosomal protein S18 acetylase RimI-like enzyme